MPLPSFQSPMQGGTIEERLKNISDIIIQMQKELEFIFQNLDHQNVVGVSSNWTYSGNIINANMKGSVDFSEATSINGLVANVAGSHDHGIPNGTVLMVQGGGTVTWNEESDHTHDIEGG